jgi:hypothetical protein
MTLFATYDPSTRKILRVGQCQESDLAVQAGAGDEVIERTDASHDDGNAYVDLSGLDPVVTARPEMGANISGLTISDVPVGAVLTIEGVDYTVNDGEAELSFSAAGTYTVTLAHWPHYDQSFEVVAT